MKKALLLSVTSVFLVSAAIGQAADRHSPAGKHPAVERVTFHGEWFPLYGKRGTPITKGNLGDAEVKPDDDIAVPEGASVVLDGRTTCRNLYIAGELKLKPGFYLEAVTIVVAASGVLVGGDQGEIVFRDRPIDTKLDPFQTGHGLIVWGHVDLRGCPKTAWLEAAEGLSAGADTVRLAARPEGWAVGDELLVTDTKQQPNTGELPKYDVEYVRIRAIEGNVVTIQPALKHDRPEYNHQRTGKRLVPHIGNLTRSLTLRSENPEGTRAHGIILGRAEGDFRHVAIVGMGRTKATERLDNTFVADFDKGDSGVQHIGKNQIGRYPVHYHHTGGTRTAHAHLDAGKRHGHPARRLTADRKERFVVDGCVIKDNRKWGLTIHGTSDGVAANNVIVQAEGAAIMTEDGTERHNLIEGNLVCDIGSQRGPSTRGGVRRFRDTYDRTIVETGFEGTGIWLRAGGNIVRQNVAANCRFAAMMMNGYYESVPKAAGIHPVPIKELSHNLGYGCRTGLYMAHYQAPRSGGAPYSKVGPHTFWHISGNGLQPYHAPVLHFEELVLIADPAVSRQNVGPKPGRHTRLSVGLHLGNPSYNVGGLIVDRAEVYGCNVGMTVPQNTNSGGDETGALLHKVVLQNHVNIWCEFTKHTEHLVEIKRAEFLPAADALPRNLPDDLKEADELDVAMVWPPYKRAHPVRRETRLFVNGERYYYLQQAPDFVIPEHRLLTGEDEQFVGLTVQQAWEKHGQTIGGQVTPSTERRPRVLGFVSN